MEVKTDKMRPRVALVIGAGGIKCAAALGLWKVLDRQGIDVDMAVGCSGGSVYAAALALGWDVADAEEASLEMWSGMFSRFHLRSLVQVLLPRIFGFSERFGLIDDRRVNRVVMKTLFGDSTFDQTHIPLYVVATDLYSGAKVVLSEGKIGEAVRASIAIPLMLPPQRIGDKLLIDGGVSDPLPVDVAIREGYEIILAMGFENPYAQHHKSFLDLVNQTTNILINNLLQSRYAFYNVAHHSEIIPIIPDFDRPIQLTDTHLIPYIVEQGERAAEAHIPYLRKLLATTAC